MKRLWLIAILILTSHTGYGEEKTAKELFFQGVQLYRAQRYPEAIHFWEKALQIHKRASIYFNIARAYHKLADPKKERHYYIEALKAGLIKSEQMVSYSRIIACSLKLNDPITFKAYIKIALTHYKGQKEYLKQILEILQSGMAYSLKNKDCLFCEWLLPYAQQYRVQKDTLLGLKNQCDSTAGHHNFKIGQNEIALGRIKQGVQHLQKALTYLPNETEFLMELARVYSQQGDKKRAVPYLKRILKIEPRHQQASLLLETLVKTAKVEFNLKPSIYVTYQGKKIPYRAGEVLPFPPGEHVFVLFDSARNKNQPVLVNLKDGEKRRIEWKYPMSPYHIAAWSGLGAGLVIAILGGVLYWTTGVFIEEDPKTGVTREKRDIGPSIICWAVSGALLITATVLFLVKPKKAEKWASLRF